MKKRYITSLLAGGLLAAILRGAAVAQTEGQVALNFALDPTCEFGQGSALPLPACALDESTGIMTITASDPANPPGAIRWAASCDDATDATEQGIRQSVAIAASHARSHRTTLD